MRRFFYYPVIIKIFSDTADGIPAHTAFASVSIEHSHSCVRNAGTQYQYNPVTANAGMPVRQQYRQRFRRIDSKVEAVDKNIVIAASVHFSKRQL
jgi:hypothetical protein